MRRRVIDLAAIARARAALAETVKKYPELTSPAAQSRAATWLAGAVEDPIEVDPMSKTATSNPTTPRALRPLKLMIPDALRERLRVEATRRGSAGEVNASMANLIRELLDAGLNDTAPQALRAAVRRGR